MWVLRLVILVVSRCVRLQCAGVNLKTRGFGQNYLAGVQLGTVCHSLLQKHTIPLYLLMCSQVFIILRTLSMGRRELDTTVFYSHNNMKMILFVDLCEEGFLLVVEDATTLWTVLLHAGSNQVLVPGDKEAVIVHELLPDHLFHPGEKKVSPARSSFKLAKAFLTSRISSLCSLRT